MSAPSTYLVTDGKGKRIAEFGCADCIAGHSTCGCVLEAFQEARNHGQGTTIKRGRVTLGQVWSKAYGRSPVLNRAASEVAA